MKKKVLSTLLACCMAFGLFTVTALAANSDTPFTDVQSTDWFYEGVQYVYENEMMNGTSDTTFAPETPANRAMIVTILYRKEKSPAVSGSGFSDVPAGQYYSDAAVWAAKNGIVTGYDNGKFGPDDPVTREQLAAILYRYANFKKYDTTAGVALGKFADAKAVSGYALDAMSWANAAGLITGTDLGKLEPAGKATRSQTAMILTRFCKTVREKGTVSRPSGGFTPFGPTQNDLTVSTAKTVTGGTYDDVTITAAVGDGDVTLDGVTIKGKLLVKGGGSHSIHLSNCAVDTIEVKKEGGEAPRLDLQGTPVKSIEASQPVIIEADETSAIEKVTAKDNVTVQGESRIETIEVPDETSKKPVIDVQGGSVGTVEANKPAEVKGGGIVSEVKANAAVTVDSDTVETLTVAAPVTVTITGEAPIAVSVETTEAVRIDAEDAPVEITTTETEAVHVQINEQTMSHVHNWTEASRTPATCAKEGSVGYTCSGAGTCDLGNTKTETLPKLPHTEVTDPAVAPTCETEGKTEGKHCSVCHGVIVAQQTVPALGHSYGAVSYTWTQAGTGYTCTAKRICANNASHVETETVTAAYVETAAPTCTATGSGTYTATFTNANFAVQTKTVTVPVLGHAWASVWSSDETQHWHVCTREGCTAKNDVANHNPGAAATETTAQTCTACGYELAPETGHLCKNHLTAHAAVSATCEDAGNSAYWSCTCGNFYSDVNAANKIDENSWIISALGHNWATAWSKDESYHWHVCQREGCDAKNDAANHVPGAAATEDTAQTCTVCGYEIAPATGHVCANHLTPHTAVSATCEDAGSSAYWSCTCGKYFSDANAATEIAENSWVIPALGHAYGTPSYEWAAVTGGYTCTAKRICTNDAGHVETETVTAAYAVTTDPTCEDKGEGTYTATFTNSAFAAQTRTAEIAELGHDYKNGACERCGQKASYTVRFLDYDGTTVLSTQSVAGGESATAPQNPTRAGYDFVCWNADFTNVTANLDVTAQYVPAGEPAFIISNAKVKAGDSNILITVSVLNNPGILGMKFTLTYDDNALLLKSSANGSAVSSILTLTKPKQFENGCSFLWDGVEIDPDDIKDGDILTLRFDIANDASLGEYPITISYGEKAIIDDNLRPISIINFSGCICVE